MCFKSPYIFELAVTVRPMIFIDQELVVFISRNLTISGCSFPCQSVTMAMVFKTKLCNISLYLSHYVFRSPCNSNWFVVFHTGMPCMHSFSICPKKNLHFPFKWDIRSLLTIGEIYAPLKFGRLNRIFPPLPKDHQRLSTKRCHIILKPLHIIDSALSVIHPL